MINEYGVIENIKALVGNQFNEDDVICAFEDYEENGENKVYFDYLSNGDIIASIDTLNNKCRFYITTRTDYIDDEFVLFITDVELWRY